MIWIDSNGDASVRTDYRDTVYDSLAAANRIGRANQQAIYKLYDLILFALIIFGAYVTLKGFH